MAAVRLLLQRMHGGLEAWPGEDFQMAHPRWFPRSTDRRGDRRDGAEAGVEDQDPPRAKPDESVGNLGHHSLEGPVERLTLPA